MREVVDGERSLTAAQHGLDDELCTWPAGPALYTRANAVDQWPRPITALTQDLVAAPQERGLGRAFAAELACAPEGPPWTWNGVFYGWYFYGVEPAALMADNLPGYSRVAVYSDYFGVSEDPDAPPRNDPPTSPLRVARIAAGFLRAMYGYPHRATRMAALAGARLAADLRRDWTTAPDGELVARLDAHPGEAVEFRVPHVLASVISAPLFQAVVDTARRVSGPDADRLVTEAVSGLGGIHLREATRAMAELAAGRLDRERFLAAYGYRGTNEFELAAPPWRDDPVTLDRLVDGVRRGERADRTAERRARARARLRADAGPRWPLLAGQLRLLATHLRWRENGKVPMAMATHSMRLIAREAGGRLAARGRLAQPKDVFHLRLDELAGELSGRPVDALSEAVARRRRTLEVSATLRVPEMLDVSPGQLAGISPARWKSLGVLPPPPDEITVPTRLAGVGGAPGTVTGRARIVHDPNDVELAEGDVIVARGTDSAWTPLFFEAAGVIVDVGGPMSHSAIAAREVGIPCVVNVKVGTERIVEGAEVTVDGDTGVVHLALG